MPKAFELLRCGHTEQLHAVCIVGLRHRRLQDQQLDCSTAEFGERLLQQRRIGERIGRVAQRVAEAAQLLGLLCMTSRMLGSSTLQRDQRGDDPGDEQHRAEQQRVLAQVDDEGAARRHENPIEREHGRGTGEYRYADRQPQRRHRRAEHEHHCEVGQVDLAVEPQHAGPCRRPDRGAGQQPVGPRLGRSCVRKLHDAP